MRYDITDGLILTVIARPDTEDRLKKTCFREGVRRAGNFSHWRQVRHLFGESRVLLGFVAEVKELWKQKDFGTHSVEFDHGEHVGWESTAPLSEFDAADLEEFQPNRKSSGLRVKEESVHLRAPRTSFFTIVFEFKRERNNPVAVIHSIYPGRDIGELAGDVTARENRVFFDWDHAGQ